MTRKSHNHRTATRERDTEQCQPHNRKNTFSKVTISLPLHQYDECKTKKTKLGSGLRCRNSDWILNNYWGRLLN